MRLIFIFSTIKQNSYQIFLYDERIDFASLLFRDKTIVFKITMTRTMKNKIVWNNKIKKIVFKFKNLILIKIKKFKKFKMNWYNSYEIIQNKILNIYVFKFFENSFNNYFMNDDTMKLININEFFFLKLTYIS